MTTPQEPAPDTETEVTPGDVTEKPRQPDEDGSTPHTAEDAEGDPPLDADEGDPDPDDSVPAG